MYLPFKFLKNPFAVYSTISTDKGWDFFPSIVPIQNAGAAGTVCCSGNSVSFTGGKWYSRARFKRNDDLQSVPAAAAKECVEPNVFGYAPGPDAGAWEIRAEDVKERNGNSTFAELHEEFQSCASHDEKMTWLQSHEASYKPRLHDEPVSFSLFLCFSVRHCWMCGARGKGSISKPPPLSVSLFRINFTKTDQRERKGRPCRRLEIMTGAFRPCVMIRIGYRTLKKSPMK